MSLMEKLRSMLERHALAAEGSMEMEHWLNFNAAEETLKWLSTQANDNAMAHGFYDDAAAVEDTLSSFDAPEEIGAAAERHFLLTQLALIGTEVSEAIQAVRKGEELGPELADVIIRTLDLAAAEGIDIGATVVDKMIYNEGRPYKHGRLV